MVWAGSGIPNTKYIRDVLENEVVEAVLTADPDQDHFYALCSTSNEIKILKTEVPTGRIIKRLKVNLALPNNLYKMKACFEDPETESLDKIYFVTKLNDQFQLLGKSKLSTFKERKKSLLLLGRWALAELGEQAS